MTIMANEVTVALQREFDKSPSKDYMKVMEKCGIAPSVILGGPKPEPFDAANDRHRAMVFERLMAFFPPLPAPALDFKGIQDAVSIPVMAKCRIGHFAEAQILQAIEIDYIDESEVLSPADDIFHINKRDFDVPFVCGAKDLGEALRRIEEGASMIRTKGEPGTGDIVQAVRHMRLMNQEIARISSMREDELFNRAKELQVSYDLVRFVHDYKKLPVVNFAAGGVATPADAALMMQLGAEGVFVGSGIFKSGNPAKRAAAIVQAVTNYTDAKLIAKLSENLGEAMVGINEQEIVLLMAERGK